MCWDVGQPGRHSRDVTTCIHAHVRGAVPCRALPPLAGVGVHHAGHPAMGPCTPWRLAPATRPPSIRLQVHWFSIINSILVVLVMATIVGMILVSGC